MNRHLTFVLTALLAVLAWGGAAVSALAQKMDADSTAGSFDASAIQIQQLNGSVQSHAFVCLLIATALTVPLLIVAVHALMKLSETPEEVAAKEAYARVSKGAVSE